MTSLPPSQATCAHSRLAPAARSGKGKNAKVKKTYIIFGCPKGLLSRYNGTDWDKGQTSMGRIIPRVEKIERKMSLLGEEKKKKKQNDTSKKKKKKKKRTKRKEREREKKGEGLRD